MLLQVTAYIPALPDASHIKPIPIKPYPTPSTYFEHEKSKPSSLFSLVNENGELSKLNVMLEKNRTYSTAISVILNDVIRDGYIHWEVGNRIEHITFKKTTTINLDKQLGNIELPALYDMTPKESKTFLIGLALGHYKNCNENS